MLDVRVVAILLASAPFSCYLVAGDVTASGTGFAVTADGHVLTNAQVVTGCGEVIEVLARVGERQVQAQVLSVVAQNDLALLKVASRFGTVLPLRDGTRVRLGEPVAAFGYPAPGILPESLHMTAGNVGALAGLAGDARSLQFIAPIQPGSGGGPLVDGSGNVVGIVMSKLSPIWSAKNIGDVPQNVNLALKASVIRDFLESRGVDYVTGTLASPVAITDLPAKVSAAVVRLQCIGSGAANTAQPTALGRAQSPVIEWRRGVLIAGYGSPATSYQYIFSEIENALTAYGVRIANRSSDWQLLTGEEVSIHDLVDMVRRQGSASLLHLKVDRDSLGSGYHALARCFDADGNLLWEEDASSGRSAATEQAAARSVAEQLRKKLKAHIGTPYLPLR